MCLGLFVFPLSSFQLLRSHEASEGLAPFRSRTLGRHFADLATASLIEREHEGTSRPRRTGEKTGGSIRCPARMRPLEKSPIRLEPLVSGRAPALHACECLTTPAFEYFPFGSPRVADAAAFCRARSGAFHPAIEFKLAWFRCPVKKLLRKVFQEGRRRRSSRRPASATRAYQRRKIL